MTVSGDGAAAGQRNLRKCEHRTANGAFDLIFQRLAKRLGIGHAQRNTSQFVLRLRETRNVRPRLLMTLAESVSTGFRRRKSHGSKPSAATDAETVSPSHDAMEPNAPLPPS